MATKVLIVEDDTFLSSILRNTLQKAGYDAASAFNSDEATEKAASWRPDIILLDILLPPRDGFAVLETVRADPHTEKTPVIILSNVNNPEYVQRAKDLHVVDYIVKVSATPESIAKRVQEILT